MSAEIGVLDRDDPRSESIAFDEAGAKASVIAPMPADAVIPLSFYKDAVTGIDIVVWHESLVIDNTEVPSGLGIALTRELLDGEGSGHGVLAAVRGLMESAWQHREYARRGFYRRIAKEVA